MITEDEFKKLLETYIESNRSTDKKNPFIYDEELMNSAIKYMYRQINESTKLGSLNHQQFLQAVSDAEYGLFLEVYLNNYSDDLIKKDPLFISCVNTIRLLFSRVYNGADRNLALAEIQSRQPITISRG